MNASMKVTKKKMQFMIRNAKLALSIAQVLFVLSEAPFSLEMPFVPMLTDIVPGVNWVQFSLAMNRRR